MVFVSLSVLVSDTDLYGMVYHRDQWFLTILTAKEVKTFSLYHTVIRIYQYSMLD
jgi:hypothetical protein